MSLTALVLPTVGQVAPPGGWACVAMVAAEILCGGALGWMARCITLALPIAGQIISFMLGLSSVVSVDPSLGQSSSIMRIFTLTAPVLLLKTGLWVFPVAALVESYGLIAPGHFLPVADSAGAALATVADATGLALRLAAPFMVASVVWQTALALLARLVSQLQVYFIAMPGQILGGLALLSILSASLVQAWIEAVQGSFLSLPGLR